MIDKEAIKYLQQLYPNGGHCWLDEQRIEAIGMAVKALQAETTSRTPADIEAAMQEVEEKSRAFTEAHNGEYADTILAQMRGEEPVSDDLEEASKEWLKPQLDKSYAEYGETKMMELTRFDGYAMLDAIEFGAMWQQRKTLSDVKKAVAGKAFQFSMENVEAWGDDSNGKTIKLKGRVTFQVRNPESIIDALFATLENDN